MKKTLLSLGSVAAVAAPIAGVVACSEDTKEKSLNDVLTSKVLVLITKHAETANATLIRTCSKRNRKSSWRYS